MTDETEPKGEETIEPIPERTRESEIKANLEFWTDPYWKEKGIEVTEEEIRNEVAKLPEVVGMDFIIYIPEDIKITDIVELMQKRYRVITSRNDGWRTGEIWTKGLPKTAFAQAIKYQQNPDKDSLRRNAKSVKKWVETKDDFLSPAAYLVAALRYHNENGAPFDNWGVTMFPHSRVIRGMSWERRPEIPKAYYDLIGKRYVLSGYRDREEKHFYMGVRRAVSSWKN
ncbi:MAG: hypothetical protein NT039_04410 [Candidatus Berkelbacteria bacterium]|nr:hypothetical protein [Candidatus Berkelbacteria bacterium]